MLPPLSSNDEDGELRETNVLSVMVAEVEDCRQPLIDYLEYEKLPKDLKHKTEIRVSCTPVLILQQSTLSLLLRCLGDDEIQEALEEAHLRVCGAHQSTPKLHNQLKK